VHIYGSEGPSGLNKDYLFELEKALDTLSPDSGDEHIRDLADRVRAIEAHKSTIDIPEPTGKAVDGELKKVNSTDEQEEVEK